MSDKGGGFLADPRPQIVFDGDAYRVAGGRCVRRAHALLKEFARCPRCGSPVEPATFGPDGTTWATTRVHVPGYAGEEVPYVLAYVDLNDGPRILLRLTNAPDGAAVGDRVRLGALTTSGNPTGEVIG
jgi:uncharacterized OB-fold protein